MGTRSRGKIRKTTKANPKRGGLARVNASKIAALQLEVDTAISLGRRHAEELAIQFKRIAQLQAELDEVKKILRVGG